jgi:hypothetical protein
MTSENDDIYERLEKRFEALEEKVREVCAEKERLRVDNEELRNRVEELEHTVHELRKDSSNSGRPPSSDPPFGRGNDDDGDDEDEVVFDFDDRRQQGGQPGHPGHHREMYGEDEVDEVVELTPDACRGCGTALSGEDDDPSRFQLPRPEPSRSGGRFASVSGIESVTAATYSLALLGHLATVPCG